MIDHWQTPQEFFDLLDEEFSFTLDPCATLNTAKCAYYFDEKANGLRQSWGKEIVFCNPPYDRKLSKWVAKAYREGLKGATVVCLLPPRTDTSWWHNFVMRADEIRFVRDRLTFGKDRAPFASVIVIFYGCGGPPKISSYDRRKGKLLRLKRAIQPVYGKRK